MSLEPCYTNEACWEPLEAVASTPIGLSHGLDPARFMFMGYTEFGIATYKHYDTRRYINIKDGVCYRYIGGGLAYQRIDTERAIRHALS